MDYLCLQSTREGQASHAHVHRIIGGLRRRGWSVRLVEPRPPRPGRLDGVRRATGSLGAQARHIITSRGRVAPLLYVRGHFLALPTVVWGRLCGARIVQEVNGPAEDILDAWPLIRPLVPIVRWSTRVQMRLADAVIAVTPELAEYAIQMGARRQRCHVIGNGADEQAFRPGLPRREGLPARYAVFVGALASWQGLDVALRAVMASAWPPGVGLVVVGDGRERGRVQDARARGVPVIWLPAVPFEEVGSIVANAVAALVPMTGSGRGYGLSPLKLFEAMACGVPVVASDLPGLSGIVTAHRCGVLVPAGDADALASAVAALGGDLEAGRAMGARGRVAVVDGLSWDARAATTDTILRALIERSRRS